MFFSSMIKNLLGLGSKSVLRPQKPLKKTHSYCASSSVPPTHKFYFSTPPLPSLPPPFPPPHALSGMTAAPVIFMVTR